MDRDTQSYVMGDPVRRRRKKLLALRAGGLSYGIGAFGYPGGAITGVQGNGGTYTDDCLGSQFGGGGGPITDAGGSGDSGGAAAGGDAGGGGTQ